MKEIKITCDRCGVEIKEHPVKICPEVVNRETDYIQTSIRPAWGRDLQKYDFCDKCAEEIVRFAKTKPKPTPPVLIMRELTEKEAVDLAEKIKKEPVTILPAEQPTTEIVESPPETRKPTISELILQGLTKKEVMKITGCKSTSYDVMKHTLKKKGLLANIKVSQEPVLTETGDVKTYDCNKVKNKCFYGVKHGSGTYCDYIGIEGHRRGCKPEECDKFRRK